MNVIQKVGTTFISNWDRSETLEYVCMNKKSTNTHIIIDNSDNTADEEVRNRGTVQLNTHSWSIRTIHFLIQFFSFSISVFRTFRSFLFRFSFILWAVRLWIVQRYNGNSAKYEIDPFLLYLHWAAIVCNWIGW